MSYQETSQTPQGWSLITLGEIGEIVSGITLGRKLPNRKTRSIPYLRVANVKDGYLDLSSLYTIEATEAEIEKCQLKFGDLLLTEGGDPDKLGRGTFWANQIPECIHQNHIFRVRFDLEKYVPQFIALQISSSYGKSYFLSHAKQTTGIATINQQVLSACPLMLPPLREQKRIVAIAQKCDRLRRTRRYTQQLSDTYLQSVFFKMFGNPETNLMGWEQFSVEDIATKITDGEHTTPERTSTGIKLLSARNVQNGYVDFRTGLDYIPEHEYQRIKKRCNPEVGDVLMSCSGSIGRVTTVDIQEPFSMVRSVALIKPNRRKVKSKYLEHWLRTPYSQQLINQSAHQSSQANIFTGQIKELPILIPPLTLQEKFAQIVRRFERLRTQQREGDRQAEHLFQTVLHGAFRGEL